MIPDNVFLNWERIIGQVINLMLSNPITAFGLYGLVITVVVNLIYRLSSPKKDD